MVVQVAAQQGIGGPHPLHTGGQVLAQTGRILQDALLKTGLVEDFHRGRCERARAGAARVFADERHVAKEFAGPEAGEALRAAGGIEEDFHLAVEDEVGGDRRVTFSEDEVSWLEAEHGHGAQLRSEPPVYQIKIARC